MRAAGPIYKRTVDFGTEEVEIYAGSFWSLLKKRIFQKGGTPILENDGTAWISTDGSVDAFIQTYRSTIGGLVCGVIRSQFREIPGVATFPYPEGEQYNNWRHYDALELQTVADIVSRLFDANDGPVIRFTPVYETGKITWHADIMGETSDPQIIRIDLDAYSGVGTEFRTTEDAGASVNQAWLASSPTRTGEADLVPSAVNTTLYARSTRELEPGEPRMSCADTSHNDVSFPATIYQYAEALSHSKHHYEIDMQIADNSVASRMFGIDSGYLNPSPGDVCVVTTSEGFYGQATFSGRINEVRGDANALFLSINPASKTTGALIPTVTQPNVRRPDGSQASRIKVLESFQRLANNPVTKGISVQFTPIGFNMAADFDNGDLLVRRIDPIGIVIVQGSVTASRMKMGTETIATLASNFPMTQISLSSFRQGATQETLQSWITADGKIQTRCDPTIYAGNTIVFSGMYTTTN